MNLTSKIYRLPPPPHLQRTEIDLGKFAQNGDSHKGQTFFAKQEFETVSNWSFHRKKCVFFQILNFWYRCSTVLYMPVSASAMAFKEGRIQIRIQQARRSGIYADQDPKQNIHYMHNKNKDCQPPPPPHPIVLRALCEGGEGP